MGQTIFSSPHATRAASLGASSAHGSERLVTRRVNECDQAAVALNLVGANLLGNASGFARGDFGGAYDIEERCLAVINVAEYGNHRWS